ncbi:MAG TPA: outer membrane beta-barrel protein [Chryseolinea sp.]|nr:outer membrane beta-barrel protein [Chryseolinea sp.]
MKRIVCLAGFLLSAYTIIAQDEGVIQKRERIDRSKSVFIGLGPSFTLGENIGDYSVGFNVEAGFVKRMNRVFSVGPSLSYLSFKYDPEETGLNNVFIGGPYYDENDQEYHQGLYFDLNGGRLTLISLALNLKLNFIPVKDDSKISLYAFAKPFISYASREAVTGTGILLENYGDVNDAADWNNKVDDFPWSAGASEVKESYDIDVSDELEKDNQVTGGIFIGPGIEFFPAGKISGFFQASIGYTFPVSYISTKAYENDVNYGNDLDVFLDNIEDYPMVEKGFPSINLQFGVSFNF